MPLLATTVTARNRKNDSLDVTGYASNNKSIPKPPDSEDKGGQGQTMTADTYSTVRSKSDGVVRAKPQDSSRPPPSPSRRRRRGGGKAEGAKKRKLNSQMSDITVPDEAALQSPPTCTSISTGKYHTAAAMAKRAEETGDGVSRVPGVWTRRGVWVPTRKLSEAVDRAARIEGRRLGDRRRQRHEDEVSESCAAEIVRRFCCTYFFPKSTPSKSPVAGARRPLA